MSGEEPKDRALSVDDYLALEEKSSIRYEYVAGDLFAMAGPSLRHNVISLNLAATFHTHLRGSPCRAFLNDVKVRIKVSDAEVVYYPDVLVACGDRRLDEHFVWDPKLVIEVLSPSTAMIDRREKSLSYRQISQLDDYMLVEQRSRHVTILSRKDNWQPRHFSSLDDLIELRSIDLSMSLRQIYEGIQ